MSYLRKNQNSRQSNLTEDMPVVKGESIFWTGFGFIVLCLALLLFALAMVFFLSVHKKEVVIVPQVTRQPLVDALIELQEKHLVPKILLKISNESGDAGTILFQNPAAGAKVVIDREILLTVSKGNLIDKVPNYINTELYKIQNDVSRLKYLSSNLLISKVHYVPRATVKPGLVVAQKPAEGSALTAPLALELWVSTDAGATQAAPASESTNNSSTP